MPVHSALTSNELLALDSPSRVRLKFYTVPTTTETARVNTPSALAFPRSSLPIDGLSANFLTNVKAGQTVWIGSTAGARDRGVYRVRKAPGATTLYIGEVSRGDTGRMLVNLRYAGITDDDYVTVFTSHKDLWSVFNVILYDGVSTTFYKDGDRAYVDENENPPPVVNIGGNWGGAPDTGQTYKTISRTATVQKWNGDVATYAWAGTGWTSTSGADTATFSGRAPAGYSELSCTVTLDTGAAFTAVRSIWVDNGTTYPLELPWPTSDSSGRDGWRANFNLPATLLASIPEGSMVHMQLELAYDVQSVPSAVTGFTGWVVGETWKVAGLPEGEVSIIGPGLVLQSLPNGSQLMTEVLTGSPANWYQCTTTLCTARYLIHYTLLYNAANVLRMFDFTYDIIIPIADDHLPEIQVQAGNIWSQLQNLAHRAGLEIGCDSAGAFWLRRHPSKTQYAGRSSIGVRCSLSEARYGPGLTIRVRRAPLVGQVRGEGNGYSATVPGYYLSVAPGTKAGQGLSEQVLQAQIVVTQDDLNTRTGLEYGYQNAEYEQVSLTLPGAWSVFEPGQFYLVNVTVAVALSPRGVALDFNIVLTVVNRRYAPNGMMWADLTGEPETYGIAGTTVPVPVQDTSIYTGDLGYPDIGDIPIEPYIPVEPPVVEPPGGGEEEGGGGGQLATDGNCAITCTDEGAVVRTFDNLETTPTWEDITPAGSATHFTQVLYDPATDYGLGAYALGNDGTDSWAYYTSNISAATVVWSEGASIAGVWTKLVAFKGEPGKVKIYGPQVTGEGGGAGAHTITFEGGDPDYAISKGAIATPGYSSDHSLKGDTDGENWAAEVVITFTNDKTITALSCMARLANEPIGSQSIWPYFSEYDSSDTLIRTRTNPAGHNFNWQATGIGPMTDTGVRKLIIGMNGQGEFNLPAWLDNVSWTTTTPDPAAAMVAYSTDYGATFAGAIPVGDSPGTIGGFDGTRLGPATLAAALSQVKIATTFGGAYGDQAGAAETARCIVVPWWRVGSISYPNNSTAPDFVMGGSFGVAKVIGGVATDITPVAGGTVEVADGITLWKGKWIAVLLDVAGARNLYITENTGTSWTLIGGSDGCAGAYSVRVKRLGNAPGPLIIATESGILYYPGIGTTLLDKEAPPGDYRSAEVYG